MITKELVKQEIDRLPDDALNLVYIFICTIQSKKRRKHRIRTFKLQGQFDALTIRELAYE